jgi:hypothetical protein
VLDHAHGQLELGFFTPITVVCRSHVPFPRESTINPALSYDSH